MSKDYAKGKPLGNNNVPFYDSPPAFQAVKTSLSENASASSILILSSITTAIEVAAIGATAYIKWLTQAQVDSSVAATSVISTAAGADFDNVVSKDTLRRFVVPISFNLGLPAGTGNLGANPANGLFTHVAIKTGTIASVAATQY